MLKAIVTYRVHFCQTCPRATLESKVLANLANPDKISGHLNGRQSKVND